MKKYKDLMKDWRIEENRDKPIPWEDEIFDTKRLRGVVKHGRIYLDRKGLYDKPQKCPIQLPIPKAPPEVKELVEAIEWLFSKEGYDASKKFDFDKWKKR
jgi:hypothetical protein